MTRASRPPRAARSVDPLARTAAQRSLCQARQGGGLSQPRRLQAARARRAVRASERASRRSSTSASRRAAGARSCAASAAAASIVGIDLLPTDPIDGVAILQMDFMDEAAPEQAAARRSAGPADLVLSDMAANTVGHPADRPPADDGPGRGGTGVRATRCCGRAAPMSPRCSPAARTTIWLPNSSAISPAVKHAKPPASRKDSSEWYVIAQGFKGMPSSAQARRQLFFARAAAIASFSAS